MSTRTVTVISTHQEIDLRTTFDYPPIPIRSLDWSAVDDATYDLGSLSGHGRTEVDAINDLFDRMEEQGATRMPKVWKETMTTKFTPGRWKAKKEHDYVLPAIVAKVSALSDRDMLVAKVYGNSPDDRAANAHLIAAPDLYAALEKLQSYNESILSGHINYRPEDHILIIKAALAKARGEKQP